MELRIKRKSVTFVSNDVIRKSGLSFGALGLFAYLLALDDGEEVEDGELCQAGICSQEALDVYKVELRAARLMVSTPDGNDVIYDDPQEWK